MSNPSYVASPIKRTRSTKTAMVERHKALFDIVEGMNPMTTRQAFYQAEVRGQVEKSEAGYNKVQIALVKMRRLGTLPYSWITDNTRWQRKPRTYSSIQEALKDTAKFYRKSLWDNAGCYVEVWLEKDGFCCKDLDIYILL